ncbi:MAG: mevalonate kinase [bacterium]|nr:mevalonate kinase [bacterium]
MKTSKGSSHGKIIWMGEHSVVYGYSAIALPLKQANVHITLEESTTNKLESIFYTGPMDKSPDFFMPIAFLFDSLQKYFNAPDMKVILSMTLVFAGGMGSSAAIACALTRAYYRFFDKEITDQTLFEWIQLSERLAHQSPSGIDAHTVLSSNPIVFTKPSSIQPLMTSLTGYLVIVHSGIKGSTLEAVSLVKEQVLHNNGQTHIDSLGQLSLSFSRALEVHDHSLLGNFMNQAQEHLRALGVSHPAIEELITLANSFGALGAKLTGGGLGGCMIAYFTCKNKLSDFINQLSHPYWIIDLEKDFV